MKLFSFLILKQPEQLGNWTVNSRDDSNSNNKKNEFQSQHEYTPKSFLGMVEVNEKVLSCWEVCGTEDGEHSLLQET